MVYIRPLVFAALACLLAALVGSPVQAASSRSRTEKQPTASARGFIPSTAAPAGSGAPVLSGLDYTALAPPGERLRIIEDQPYTYTTARLRTESPQDEEAYTSIIIVSNRADGGSYEVRLGLRLATTEQQRVDLRYSFDLAAHSGYSAGLLAAEERGEVAYSLTEVRSPLGLVHPGRDSDSHREYLAYTAAVLNPVGHDFSELPTPYRFVAGQLKVVRETPAGLALLTAEFTANDYAHSLTLTENLARSVINRLDPHMRVWDRLEYLAYYPEFEPALPYLDGEPIDPRTGDLAERPGEGCGREALPITGDVCPQCEGPHDGATPYTSNGLVRLMGPDLYRVRCSQALAAALPFPGQPKCYFEFVQRFNKEMQQLAGGTCQSGNCGGLLPSPPPEPTVAEPLLPAEIAYEQPPAGSAEPSPETAKPAGAQDTVDPVDEAEELAAETEEPATDAETPAADDAEPSTDPAVEGGDALAAQPDQAAIPVSMLSQLQLAGVIATRLLSPQVAAGPRDESSLSIRERLGPLPRTELSALAAGQDAQE